MFFVDCYLRIMQSIIKKLLLLSFIILAQIAYSQEGGPPMLVDDARVADYKEWEVNTSFNTSLTDRWELSVPHIDLNYGLTERVQLKIEAPLLLGLNKGEPVDVWVGEIIFGVKYRFLDEDKHFVSVATFPQYTFNESPGGYLPLFVEKTFGDFLVGVAMAHFFGERRKSHSELGGLLGYKPHENTDLMLEYYNYQIYHGENYGMNGYVNLGFRQAITDNFMIMGSFGTQVLTPAGGVREKFISWLGVKTLF